MNAKLLRVIHIALLGLLLTLGVALIATYAVMDFTGKDSTWVKYPLVLSTLAYSIAVVGLRFFEKQRPGIFADILLAGALLFTALADIFLLITQTHYELAVSFFIVAQALHFLRIYLLAGRRYAHLAFSVCVRLGLGVGFSIGASALGYHSPVIILACFYFPSLVMNAAESVFFSVKDKGHRIGWIVLALGFLLFIGCDVFVGLQFFGSGDYRVIWLFYGPSQLLLAVSGLIFRGWTARA